MNIFGSGFLDIKHGTTRTVLLIGKYAIKFPLLQNYKGFLKGLLANINEREYSKRCPNYFLPVLRSSRLGLFVVMPRVKPTTKDTWYFRAFMADLFHRDNDNNSEGLMARKLCEYVQSNVAMYKGKPVCIDYGTIMNPDVTEQTFENEMMFFRIRTRKLVEKLNGEEPEMVKVPQEPYPLHLQLLDLPKPSINVESQDGMLAHSVHAVASGIPGQNVRSIAGGDTGRTLRMERDRKVKRRFSISGYYLPVKKAQNTLGINQEVNGDPGN